MRRENHIALVAELVDALVSNTNGVTSLPVRSRPGVPQRDAIIIASLFLYKGVDKICFLTKILYLCQNLKNKNDVEIS